MSGASTGTASILVTGGAGFIGGALVRSLLDRTGDTATLVTVDALTYAADPTALAAVERHPRHRFEHVDLRDREALRRVFERHRPDAVVHLAAESHVDRSIDSPLDFVGTNLVGTAHLLEEVRRHVASIQGEALERFRLVHVSTDEVFGPAPPGTAFAVDAAYAPSSPYAATKAGADHLVRAWARTYGLPAVVVNATNVYGPGQYPEKLVPVMILAALEGRPMPLYGDGEQVRDWLHVDDAVEGLVSVLERGRVGGTYLLAGGEELRNLDVVRRIADAVDARVPGRAPGWSRTLIRHVVDRPGHDRRYALDDRRTREELGWRPRRAFQEGLAETVQWYLEHRQRGAAGALRLPGPGAG